MFSEFNIEKYYKKNPPPTGSYTTFAEIKELTKIPINKKFIKDHDDPIPIFQKVADRYGLELPINDLGILLTESRPVIIDLKDFFNRPRPKDIALKLGINLPNVELDSMKTPSYPSGHSAQGFLLGYFLSAMYPKYAFDFMKAAKNISYSRNVARCHYRSDSKFGEYLGKEMFNYIKDSYGF